jgi:hypothetical protein
VAGIGSRGTHQRRPRVGRARKLRRGLLAAFALLLCGAAAAQAASGTIGAVGLNDIRSDGILLPNQNWNGAADLTLAADAGVSLYRARMQLNCVDPNGTGRFNFSQPSPSCFGLSYDQLVAGLADRGMTLLPVLIDLNKSGVPVPPTSGGNPSISEFAAFAAAAASRYGPNGSFWGSCGCTPEPIQAWEVWNEENNGWWWGGNASASAYATVLSATRAALRGVDPTARIVVGGLTFAPDGQSSFVAPAAFIKGIAASDANAFDAVAVHPYTDAQGASAAQLASGAMSYVDQIASAVVAATGPSASGGPRQQVWVTEMGWSTTDASATTIAQALQDFFADVANGGRARDNIGPILWYMLRDNSTIASRDDGLGLRFTTNNGGDGGAKPAWAVLSAAARQLGSVPLPAALANSGPYVAGETAGASGSKGAKRSATSAKRSATKANARCAGARAARARGLRTCRAARRANRRRAGKKHHHPHAKKHHRSRRARRRASHRGARR